MLTLEPERSNHALLFYGNEGLGKRDLALALAHFVLTDNHSQSAKLFNAASHPDFHVVMPEIKMEVLKSKEGSSTLLAEYAARYIEQHSGKPRKLITIDQVRSLSAKLSTHPHIGKFRVILIAGAESMNVNAANALLKNLEEPPANTLFLLVADEVSKLPKTVRSRCSLVPFQAPDRESAVNWLQLQQLIPDQDCETYVSISNNHPLQAIEYYQNDYLDQLKTLLTSINHMWMRRSEVTSTAKQWQDLGADSSVDMIQKLSTDLLRFQLCDDPSEVFFPVQSAWVKTSSDKLDRSRLITLLDELNQAKRLLSTTVDELLVLESLANHVHGLPKT